MFERILNWIRGVLEKMLFVDDAKRTLKVDVAISDAMKDAINLWQQMYINEAPWVDGTTKSLGLPAAIASEFARLTVVEFKSEITGSARAEFLQGEYEEALKNMRRSVEVAAAGGGLVFKPYLDGGRIAIDFVPAWRFLPTSFNSRQEVTGAIFTEQVTRGKVFYTRMEHHQLSDEGYVVRNVAFSSHTEGSLGHECSLSEVDEWADLEPEIVIRRKDGAIPEKMLFAYFKIPSANNVDPESPLGVAVYSRAVGLIKEADEQYSRILWEYKGSELAIDASVQALKITDENKRLMEMPSHDKRLFRALDIDRGQNGDLYEVFNPAIRDVSLYNGLNQQKRMIEFNCNLAYGTLSDPQNVDKTAEEIRASKQRSYAAVVEIQASLQKALEHLVWIMDQYATMYKLAPAGEYEIAFTWGDGILQDSDKEFANRKILVDGGYLKPENLLGWYFGVDEETAAQEYMPQARKGLFE